MLLLKMGPKVPSTAQRTPPALRMSEKEGGRRPPEPSCGIKYVVRNIRPHVVELMAISRSKAGSTLFLPRIIMMSESAMLPFTIRRRQFPIRLCFGMTANRAQGQTLATVGVYMTAEFFTHGHVYVALSRCGDRRRIKVLKRMERGAKGRPTQIKNVVYKSVLA